MAGIIDWQYTTVLPLFLQAKIPKHYQNYGDEDSENLRRPTLAENFGTMNPSEQEVEMELYRRSQIHLPWLHQSAQQGSLSCNGDAQPYLEEPTL